MERNELVDPESDRACALIAIVVPRVTIYLCIPYMVAPSGDTCQTSISLILYNIIMIPDAKTNYIPIES